MSHYYEFSDFLWNSFPYRVFVLGKGKEKGEGKGKIFIKIPVAINTDEIMQTASKCHLPPFAKESVERGW